MGGDRVPVVGVHQRPDLGPGSVPGPTRELRPLDQFGDEVVVDLAATNSREPAMQD